jgi:hypothetical protein
MLDEVTADISFERPLPCVQSGRLDTTVTTATHLGPPIREQTAKEHSMTDTNEAVITEALAVIDKALADMLRRDLVSTGEVADLLLDVRTLLTHPAPSATATATASA